MRNASKESKSKFLRASTSGFDFEVPPYRYQCAYLLAAKCHDKKFNQNTDVIPEKVKIFNQKSTQEKGHLDSHNVGVYREYNSSTQSPTNARATIGERVNSAAGGNMDDSSDLGKTRKYAVDEAFDSLQCSGHSWRSPKTLNKRVILSFFQHNLWSIALVVFTSRSKYFSPISLSQSAA